MQPDGKLLVGGSFAGFNGVARNALARLNTTGTVDTSFTPPGIDGEIASLAVQPDGKLLVRGSFDKIGTTAVKAGTVRLNADGSLDADFQLSNEVIGGGAMLVQPDGKVIVGGAKSSGSTRTARPTAACHGADHDDRRGGLDAGVAARRQAHAGRELRRRQRGRAQRRRAA